MVDLWVRGDVLALARGLNPTTGAVLPLACPHGHDGAALRAEVRRETQGRPCTTVMHVQCFQCHAAVVDIAVVEPVTAPRRCGHRLGGYVGFLRGEVILACP